MKDIYTEDDAIDQRLNIGSARELARLLLASAPGKVDVPCIANALESSLSPWKISLKNCARRSPALGILILWKFSDMIVATQKR